MGDPSILSRYLLGPIVNGRLMPRRLQLRRASRFGSISQSRLKPSSRSWKTRDSAPLPTRLGDLSDIPPELRAELAGVEVDELEGKLVTIINSYGGTADLNQVLVGLFREFADSADAPFRSAKALAHGWSHMGRS